MTSSVSGVKDMLDHIYTDKFPLMFVQRFDRPADQGSFAIQRLLSTETKVFGLHRGSKFVGPAYLGPLLKERENAVRILGKNLAAKSDGKFPWDLIHVHSPESNSHSGLLRMILELQETTPSDRVGMGLEIYHGDFHEDISDGVIRPKNLFFMPTGSRLIIERGMEILLMLDRHQRLKANIHSARHMPSNAKWFSDQAVKTKDRIINNSFIYNTVDTGDILAELIDFREGLEGPAYLKTGENAGVLMLTGGSIYLGTENYGKVINLTAQGDSYPITYAAIIPPNIRGISLVPSTLPSSALFLTSSSMPCLQSIAAKPIIH